MSGGDFDFGQHMAAVAEVVFGKAKETRGNESRYGTNNSLSIDLKKGTWFAHDDKEGGGVLDFLAKYQGVQGGEAVDWLRDRGFAVPDRAPAPGSNRAAKREIVKTYDYVGPDGALVFQVCRWEPKTFTQRRPVEDEKGVWINGLLADEYMRKGPGSNWSRYDEKRWHEWKCTERREFPALVDLPLYNLPDVMEAIALGRDVFLVEGEKDADNLRAAGLCATTPAGGAKKWTDHHTAQLAGARVIAIPDNDDVGRQHMQLVGGRLRGVAESVRSLDIRKVWPGAPIKADASDWMDKAGGDLARLPDLAARLAEQWRPEPPASKFGAVPWARLDEPGAEHEYIVDDVLTRREVAILFGESKSGKSFEAIELAMSVARGVPFHGFEARKGGVVYQAGEGGIGVKKRLRAYRNMKIADGETDLPFVLLPARVDLFAEEREDVETHRGTSALIAEIKAWSATFDIPLELVVIDTLATASAGANENASTDMSTVLANCERIGRECKCAVLLVHHKPKTGNGPRGWSGLFANIENAIEIVVTERVDIEEREDGRDLARQIRRATVTKNKDGEDGRGWDFILKQVDLGPRMRREFDDDGNERMVDTGKRITSCIVSTPGDRRDSRTDGDTLTDQQHMAMTALISALESRGQETPDVLKLPRHIRRVCLYADWRAEYAKLSFIDDEDEGKQKERVKAALKRAGEKFLRSKFIGRADKFVWLTGRSVPGFKGIAETATEAAPPPRRGPDLPPEIDDMGDGEIMF